MRILLIHNRYLFRGGEDTVLEQEEALLQAQGHEVKLLLFDNKTLEGKSRVKAFLNSIYNKESAQKTSDAIREFQPEVVHIHNFIHVASPAVIRVASQCKVPVVMTLHNYRMLCPGATLYHQGQIYEDSIGRFFPWKAVLQGVYRDSKVQTLALALVFFIHRLLGTWKKVNRFLVLTDFAAALFQRGGIQHKQIVVKPNMVDLKPSTSNNRGKHGLFVGRFQENKGLPVLLEATKQLEMPPVVVLGDGPDRYPDLQSNRFDYRGSQPREEVVKQMKEAAYLVFPSVWYEGMPMTILEAFALKTPVIASDLGAMKSMIRDGETGMLFEAGNADALAQKMAWANEHPQEMRQMAENAYQEYQARYTPEKNYDLLRNIYREVIEEKGQENR